MNSHNSLSDLALIPLLEKKKTYVDTQYSMFINTYLKLGLKTCTWHQSRIHSFSRMRLLLKTERERGDDCSLSDMPKQNLHWMGKSERGTYHMRVGTSHK